MKSLSVLALRELPFLAWLLPAGAGRARYLHADWDMEYRSGRWDFLRGRAELPHHFTIAGYVNAFAPGGAVLDVGCGEGALWSVLRRTGCTRYVGLDLSAVAIAAAQEAGGDMAEFRVGAASDFASSERFSAIVFNETLYYLPDPAAALRQYGANLASDGIFIVSMAFSGLRDALYKLRVWREAERVCRTLDEIVLYTRSGPTWIVRVLEPASRPPGHAPSAPEAVPRAALTDSS